eukprot:jgi/Galph1/4965/GphlegSOOS_G3629.1
MPKTNSAWLEQAEKELDYYLSGTLPFWDGIILFNETKVLLKKGQTPVKMDCRKLWSLFLNKKEAISNGLSLDNIQYDIHRWYCEEEIPLIYGREADNLKGKGFALSKTPTVGVLVQYSTPIVSACAVPALKDFVQKLSTFTETIQT